MLRARLQGEPTQLPGPESCHAKGRIQRKTKRTFSGIIQNKFHQEKLIEVTKGGQNQVTRSDHSWLYLEDVSHDKTFC